MARSSLATWRRDLDLDALEDKEKLPRGLLTSVLRQESAGDPNATSPAGAGGLFQLMPATARAYGADPYDPRQAAPAAAKELGAHYRRYEGDLPRALAAWNWGSGNLQRKGFENAPAETRNFIRSVSGGIGAQVAAAGGETMTDMPRAQGSKTAPSKPWLDVVPDAPPPEYATPQGQGGPPAAVSRKPWLEMVPDAPPPAYAAPMPPTAAPVPPGAPAAPGGYEAPPRVQREQFMEQQAPAAVQGMEQERGTPAADPRYMIRGSLDPLDQRWVLLTGEKAPATPPEHVSGLGWRKKGLSDEQVRNDPQGSYSSIPPAKEVLRQGAETAIDVGLSTAGGMAGGAVAGPPGMVAGGIVGQGVADRLKTQLGLTPPHKPILEFGPFNLYATDLLNTGFGVLLGAPDLARAALGKTSAGKAILAADEATKKASKEYETAEIARKTKFDEGKAFDRESYDIDVARARERYDTKVKERNDLIAQHKAEFDQATQDYQTRKLQRDAEAQDIDAANYYNQQRYSQGTGQQSQAVDLTAQGRFQQAKEAMSPEQQASGEQALAESYEKAATPIVEGEAKFQRGVRTATEQTQAHGEAVERAKMLPEMYKESGDPAHVKYERAAELGQGVEVPVDTGKAAVKKFREEDYAQLLDDSNKPMPPEVEMHATRLEKLEGDTAPVGAIHTAMKELGRLTRSNSGDVRRTASALYGIYSDMLEQAPNISAAIKDANRTFKREMAVKEMEGWVQTGNKLIKRDAQGRTRLDVAGLMNNMEKAQNNKLFRGAFDDEEWAAFRRDVEAFGGTPDLPTTPPGQMARPEPPMLPGSMAAPKVAPETPSTAEKVIPQPKELTAPTLKETKAIGPFAPPPFERTRAGRKEFKEGTAPAPIEAALGPPPRIRARLGDLSWAGGTAFLLQRAGLTPGGVDALIWGTLAGVGAKMVGEQAEHRILSKALMTEPGRKLLKWSMDSKGGIDPRFYGAYVSTLSMAGRKALEREVSEPEQKGRR